MHYSNYAPPEKFQGAHVPGPYVQIVNVLVILSAAKDLNECFWKGYGNKPEMFRFAQHETCDAT